ncbi:MAG: Response regulator [uncultured Solirubrobacteraceae bacterium]|uniref:Response regulator n=1 Tax=uncultured Solirubrobacteraceae bacterium TaxID=1162706 RepID=A0A6J4SGD6_9ACTN|nr:MAG: Response regulator [uncultured Solirubrobacteraceae bacterium]
MVRGQETIAPIRPATDEVRLSEVVGALSYALDLVEGQPAGHAARSCVIGMRIADAIGLPAAARSSLFYALLLKDAGCSANASLMADLFESDDRAVKRDVKLIDPSKPSEVVAYLYRNAAAGRGRARRSRQVLRLARSLPAANQEIFGVRCERGADVVRRLELGEEAAAAVRGLDERWNGTGSPLGVSGELIPLGGRILSLAQTVEVFHAAGGVDAALSVAETRSGSWFDPDLVAALLTLREDPMWDALSRSERADELVADLEPAERIRHADADRLDRIAEAFATVIDAKSPFTLRHSEGVADLAEGIARGMGYAGSALRDLRRAALLHDVGKLAVSNRILDKPGKLDAAEWAAMREHPAQTFAILDRVSAFRPIARVAASHHERLDGSGYHLGLGADQLPPAARILAVADVCEALMAKRPYRDALPVEQVLEIMRRDVPHKLDAAAFAALQGHLEAV